MKTRYLITLPVMLLWICCDHNKTGNGGNPPLTGTAFPYELPEDKPGNRLLSAAMERFYDQWKGNAFEANELYSNFRFTPLTGFDYCGNNGTVSRRDPSKVLKINGMYYVWYTYRHTESPCAGPEKSTETIPSYDWDLSEIWYATSEDGFHWEEQGVAVVRPEKPVPGWRSVSTPDILYWRGKYYLYYQAFVETPGRRGDYCPVSASSADSPDGPWISSGKIIVPNGAEGEWDQFAIHDPYPIPYKGRIYLYYKSRFNSLDKEGKRRAEMCQGLAISDDPFGPFEKHPLNPVINSGHETGLFPYKEGIAAMVILNGPEQNTIQYAPDGVNFEIAAISEMLPPAPGPFIPDAFADNGNGRGITWGLFHVRYGPDVTSPNNLARFDCDLSLDYHDNYFKRSTLRHSPEVYFREGLSENQLKRLKKNAVNDPETILNPEQ